MNMASWVGKGAETGWARVEDMKVAVEETEVEAQEANDRAVAPPRAVEQDPIRPHLQMKAQCPSLDAGPPPYP